MGTVFEELVRKFNEDNNEEAGEHWTPRDAVRLMANLVFLPIQDQIRSGTYLLYDCACGTGGMLTVVTQQRWSVRELHRQLVGGLFERAVMDPPKLSTALREMQPHAAQHFKDAYQLDFLGLPEAHSEAQLHHSLLMNLGRFLTELGRDFCYIGSEYPLQVGTQDFALDLLFFHRGLDVL
jgi:predicted nuclease of restriction endonuclease-like (RecB) superfamily